MIVFHLNFIQRTYQPRCLQPDQNGWDDIFAHYAIQMPSPASPGQLVRHHYSFRNSDAVTSQSRLVGTASLLISQFRCRHQLVQVSWYGIATHFAVVGLLWKVNTLQPSFQLLDDLPIFVNLFQYVSSRLSKSFLHIQCKDASFLNTINISFCIFIS